MGLLAEGAGVLFHLLDGCVRNDLFRAGTDDDFADLAGGDDNSAENDWIGFIGMA
jgi:hypothetical protein